MKTLMILAEPLSTGQIAGLIITGVGVVVCFFFMDAFAKWLGKGSSDTEKDEKALSDKTEDTKEETSSSDHTQEEILKHLKAILWVLIIGFLYIMLVVSGIIPAGVFS